LHFRSPYAVDTVRAVCYRTTEKAYDLCWGDDVPEGKVTSFPMAVKRKDDETVVFSWIIWPSRNLRDEGMKKVMVDPRLKPEVNPMPFDGKRMMYGGFEMIVEA
jgi:uncharacterized protein YbaA (DUF1428 family)